MAGGPETRRRTIFDRVSTTLREDPASHLWLRLAGILNSRESQAQDFEDYLETELLRLEQSVQAALTAVDSN
jgi:hypothetical protein